MYITSTRPAFNPTTIRNKSLVALGACALVLSLWASMIPMESAVIANAYTRAKGANKPVQHLTGGRIEAVHVAAGDVVQAGEPLLTLETKEERSALEAARHEKLNLLLQRDAAVGQLRGDDFLRTSDETLSLATMLGRADLVEQSTASFHQRQETILREMDVIEARRLQIQSGRSALISQRDAYRAEMQIAASQLESIQKLFGQRLIAAFKVDEAKQTLIRLRGAVEAQNRLIEEKSRAIAQLEREIALLNSRTLQAATEQRDQAESELPAVDSVIFRLENKLSGAAVKATHDGTITQLVVRSPGSTIAAGETLMTILPSREDLIVEARLDTTDIEQVFPGQTTRLRLSAFNMRTAAILDGEVLAISADRQLDDQGYYYQVEIKVSEGALLEHAELYLAAGMPVEAYFVTAKRTVLEYLWAPVSRGLYRSMRET